MKTLNKPLARGQLGALHPLQIWLNPLGIYEISKTDMLIRFEICEDNITKSIPKKTRCVWQRGRAANDRYVTGSHAIHNAMSF